jgi:N,N'-diacetyllegionaminate synthase
MKKITIIAEAGANHNRDWSTAVKLIKAAAGAECDIVKFQTYSSETLYSKSTPDFAGYKNINKLIKDIELPREWQKDLKLCCDDLGIEFMSTPFDEKAVDELYKIGVKRFKIAGFESTDPRIVRYAASTKLPLIITAGIGTDLKTIEEIYNWVKDENPNPDITFLHGNNAYPTPFEDINLGQIQKIKSLNLQIAVGLSDHTLGILIPPIAVGLGATTIEKHYTLDRGMIGPDHPFAIEPVELSEMVKNIRTTELCLGNKHGKNTESEESFIKATRSIVAKKTIKKGDTITFDNLTTKRPFLENCVPAKEFYNIQNSYIASADINEDHLITWNDITRIKK